MFENESAILRVTLLLILGILIGSVTNLSLTTSFLLSLFFLLISTICFYFKQKGLLNIFLFLLIISFGSVLIISQNSSIKTYPFKKSLIRKADIFGKIIEKKLPTEKGIDFVIKTDSIFFESKKLDVKVNLLCRTKSKKDSIKVADFVKISGNVFNPRNQRNPGEFDYREYLNKQNIQGQVSVKEIRKILDKTKINLLESIQNYIYDFRLSISNLIENQYPDEKGDLIKALIIGMRKDIDKDILESFVNVGVVHVLAVSGLHVGFIVLILTSVLGRFNLFLRSFLIILGILFFLLISGGQPSVMRASIMAIIMVLSFLTGRKYKSVSVLAIAAFLILIFNPQDLFNPGFQLSFSAVFSILYFYPKLQTIVNETIKSKYIKQILLFLSLTIAAQIGTLPFTIFYFNKFSIISFLLNLFVVPLIGIIVAIAIASLVFSPILFLSLNMATTNSVLIKFLFSTVSEAAKWDFSYIEIFWFNIPISILYFVLLMFLIYTFKKIEHLYLKIIVLILSVAAFFIYSDLLETKIFPENKVSIMMIDIGQGDSFLIHFPTGENYLVDAGNATKNFDNGKSVIYPLLKKLGIKKIDKLLISHTDADHYLGSYYLIKKGIVAEIYKPNFDSTLRKEIVYENFIRKNHIPLKYYHRQISEVGNAKIFVLNDSTNTDYRKFKPNNKSGLLKLVIGETEVLFTGDLEKEGEKLWLEYYGDFLQSDILKAGHHGSKGSTSEEFLDIVNPKLTLISAGLNNKFRHPNFETIQKFNDRKIQILRTDSSGAIIIALDGKSIEQISWK